MESLREKPMPFKINDLKKRKVMIRMLIIVGILFALIFLYKGFVSFMMKRFFASQSPVETVSTIKAEYQTWQHTLKATGSVRAIKGVNVTTELAGMVKNIYFTPGSTVEQGTVLVQLNADSDVAQLLALQATAELARITYERDKAQYAFKAVSKQTVDADLQNLKNALAQVAQQAANVEKKTIRAPFTGHLGISAVNPGQYLNPGDKVVNLQSLDPIYVDFYLPQQALAHLRMGQEVQVKSDTFPKQVFKGKITTIDPAVDTNTRNVEVEATLSNPKYELTPGMFVAAEVDTGAPQRYITLPQAAISYNPYGDIVYIVRKGGKDKHGKENKDLLIAKQAFVVTGPTRGDQVAVLQGVKEHDVVVTSGQLKLKNGSVVAINNKVQPSNSPTPDVPNEGV